MDIEKLIEQLNEYFEGKELGRGAALDAATVLSTFQAENEKLQKMYQEEKVVCHATQVELERMKQERDAAIKTIFQWVGCPECKYWDSADEWCEKHDREADSCGGCDSPEWRGQKED